VWTVPVPRGRSPAIRTLLATAALVALTLSGAAAAAWVFQINWRIVVQQKEFPAQPPQPGVRVPTPIRSIPPPGAGTQR